MDIKDMTRTALCGIAMGAADVVPGVSGGTIAFITGIYSRLLKGIETVNLDFFKEFFTGKFKQAFARIPFDFFIPLLLGIALSIFSLAKFILYLLASYPIIIWSFFFGLIVASVVILFRELSEHNLKIWLTLFIGAFIAWQISVLTPMETPNSVIMTFLSGAIAICAMILPGVSGSFLLVLMGKYQYILHAVSTFDIPVMLTFICGALVGILSFVRVLNYALSHYYLLTVALLTGFMLGSLRKVWPWKTEDLYLALPQMDSTFLVALCFCAVGVAIPLLLHYMAGKNKI